MDEEKFKKIKQKEKYAEETSIKYRGEIIHQISMLERKRTVLPLQKLPK